MSHRVWVWVKDHATRVIVMLVVAIAISVAAWTWSYLAEQHAEEATAEIGRGLEIYNASVVELADVDKQGDDGIPRFQTRNAKLKAAEREFGQVVGQRGSGDVGLMAVLMRAGARLELGRYADAAKDYERFVQQADRDHALRSMAIEGLIYAFEAQKKWDAAINSVARLPRDGEKRFEAMYHEARILLAKGDRKGAVKRYREIVEQAGSRFLVDRASRWLATLQDA